MTQAVRHFLLALQFFTRIPVTGRLADWVGFSPAMLRASAAHFPGVGWVVGGLTALVFWGLTQALPGQAASVWVAAVVSTAFSVWLTGAFHEDGLADLADLGLCPIRMRHLVGVFQADVERGRLPGAVRHQCWGRDLLSLPASDPGFAIIKPSGSDQTVAMLSGEHILVLPKGGPARGYQYRLGRQAQALPLTTPTQEQRLGQQLQAYLQTATSSLLGNTTGVVDNNAMPQGANVAELSSKLAPVRGK